MRATGGCTVKLVTFGDDGLVGVLDGDEIAVLDVSSMRRLFEEGGADDTGERIELADTKLRAPIVPKKFFHTAGNFREHEEESKQVGCRTRSRPGSSSSRTSMRSSGRTSRSSIPST